MAWSEPRTWVAGDIVKVSQFNSDVRDDLRAASRLLARVAYNPAATTANTSSTTVADIDSTNLVITFTVPASGIVLVRLSACIDYNQNSSTNGAAWALRESTTTIATVGLMGRNTERCRCEADLIVTGLTPGASTSYKWAHVIIGAGIQNTYYGGTEYGPAVMEAWGLT